MKLVVPHVGELQAADARLIRLAEFLGVRCQPLRLPKEIRQYAEYLERAVPDRNSCLVINPRVMREWINGDVLPADLVSCFVSRFSHLFVHALKLDSFVTEMVAALSSGKLRSVQAIPDAGQRYEISSNSKDICGPFSGLSFGPINAENDRVLAIGGNDPNVRQLIHIGGNPHMAVVKRDGAEIVFLASEDTADIEAEISGEPVRKYFSVLLPHAMALRHIFAEECWRPGKPHASIIIDDPLLRREYGYLNFESLLRLSEKHNFHTTISFIPHNYKRSSARTIQMFRESAHRLSICFHGNDHTEAELASNDFTLLNRVLGVAEERMKQHEEATGLRCDKVMVFPQDQFSIEAMEVLKSRNFHGASSSPNPAGKNVALTIADFAQPAVLRYGGVPLFIRHFIRETHSQDIAFNIFFGRPILIGEHHDLFKDPGSLLEVVQAINSIAPGISWSGLESAVDNSSLRRRKPDGTVQVRPYSSSVLIANDSSCTERFSIEWDQSQSSPVEQVLRDGIQLPSVELDDTGIRALAELPPGASQMFSVTYGNNYAQYGASENPDIVRNAKVFLRRRLSELRDNYLSKNQHVLTAAKALQRRFLK